MKIAIRKKMLLIIYFQYLQVLQFDGIIGFSCLPVSLRNQRGCSSKWANYRLLVVSILKKNYRVNTGSYFDMYSLEVTPEIHDSAAKDGTQVY